MCSEYIVLRFCVPYKILYFKIYRKVHTGDWTEFCYKVHQSRVIIPIDNRIQIWKFSDIRSAVYIRANCSSLPSIGFLDGGFLSCDDDQECSGIDTCIIIRTREEQILVGYRHIISRGCID